MSRLTISTFSPDDSVGLDDDFGWEWTAAFWLLTFTAGRPRQHPFLMGLPSTKKVSTHRMVWTDVRLSFSDDTSPIWLKRQRTLETVFRLHFHKLASATSDTAACPTWITVENPLVSYTDSLTAAIPINVDRHFMRSIPDLLSDRN